jgi:hypothetical protein
MARGRSRHLEQGENVETIRSLKARIEGLEEQVARLAHIASVWDLVTAAVRDGRRLKTGRGAVRLTGVRLTTVREPRRLRDRVPKQETDLARIAVEASEPLDGIG